MKAGPPRPFLTGYEAETEIVRRPRPAGITAIPHRAAVAGVLASPVGGYEGAIHSSIDLPPLRVILLLDGPQLGPLHRCQDKPVDWLGTCSPGDGWIVGVVYLV